MHTMPPQQPIFYKCLLEQHVMGFLCVVDGFYVVNKKFNMKLLVKRLS